MKDWKERLQDLKCVNGANVYLNNPDLIQRRQTRGRTGAKYYEYRIAPNPTVEKIKNQDLLEFYKDIKEGSDRIKREQAIKNNNNQ